MSDIKIDSNPRGFGRIGGDSTTVEFYIDTSGKPVMTLKDTKAYGEPEIVVIGRKDLVALADGITEYLLASRPIMTEIPDERLP